MLFFLLFYGRGSPKDKNPVRLIYVFMFWKGLNKRSDCFDGKGICYVFLTAVLQDGRGKSNGEGGREKFF